MIHFGHHERSPQFELSGVNSEWQLKLPAKVRQFDYDTISDVILHLRSCDARVQIDCPCR